MTDQARRMRARESGRIGVGLSIWIGAVAALLLAPTIAVVPMSFTSSKTFKFPPPGWSLQWYAEFFGSDAWLAAIGASLRVAVIVSVVATVVGVAAAIGLDRWSGPGKGAIRSLLMAPMIVPLIVVAVAIYSVFLEWQLAGGVLGLALAHTVLAVPFVVVSVTASLEGYDRELNAAAASLGATPLRTFVQVMLPLILPGVASGFVFAFVTSFDEVVVALFLQSPTFETLPIKMYDAVATDIDPTVAAASTVMLAVTICILLTPELRRRNR